MLCNCSQHESQVGDKAFGRRWMGRGAKHILCPSSPSVSSLPRTNFTDLFFHRSPHTTWSRWLLRIWMYLLNPQVHRVWMNGQVQGLHNFETQSPSTSKYLYLNPTLVVNLNERSSLKLHAMIVLVWDAAVLLLVLDQSTDLENKTIWWQAFEIPSLDPRPPCPTVRFPG